MNYPELEQKRDFVNANVHLLSEAVRNNYEDDFIIEYTHNSTAIEGNTLSLMETKLLLEDRLSVGGKELRELYEVTNHAKAFGYVKGCVDEGKPLDESAVKDIHAILLENIQPGGFYRSSDVRITGAGFRPPSPSDMYIQVKGFFAELPYKTGLNPIELAAWTHAEFVRIHPFEDGNGRTSRMIMNYQLMMHGFLPLSVPKERRLEYYDALESYAVGGDLVPFAEMIFGLELPRLDQYAQAIEMVMTQTHELTME